MPYHSLASICPIGIMMNVNRLDDEFPRLTDMPYTWIGESVPDPGDELADWLVVAINPRALAYFDDEREAIDESNLSTVFGDDMPRIGWIGRGWNHSIELDGIDEAIERGFGAYGRVIIAPPDVDEDLIASWCEARERLEDYPFLDEDDYSRREDEAWTEWAESGGLQYDAIAELREAGVDESVVEAIDDSWSDVWPIAMDYLDEYRGFTGECSPSFHEAIVGALAAGTIRALVGASPSRF